MCPSPTKKKEMQTFWGGGGEAGLGGDYLEPA